MMPIESQYNKPQTLLEAFAYEKINIVVLIVIINLL